MFVVNYRNEPLALRVFDPNKVGPDGKRGMQADGLGGDLAYALQTRTDRAIPAMNLAPSAITQAVGPTGGTTLFPPHINKAGSEPGDPSRRCCAPIPATTCACACTPVAMKKSTTSPCTA